MVDLLTGVVLNKVYCTLKVLNVWREATEESAGLLRLLLKTKGSKLAAEFLQSG